LQAPQLVTVLSSVSQPGEDVQSAYPALHTGELQTPLLQVVSAFGKTHDVVSTQLPEQVSGLAEVHVLTHWPFMHSGEAVGQALPHPPQFAVVVRLVSQNSTSEEEQCPNPVSHELSGIEHFPFVHFAGAPARTCS
jgi:hypothetical protein